VGETLAPSVRRKLRPLLALVLIGTGFLVNVPLVVLALVVHHVSSTSSLSPNWAAAVSLSAVVLDGLLVWRAKPRPFAVRSQVPQWWGHTFGPWWGSVRYGFRLGLGPATLLNSWLWWAGVVVLLPFPRWLMVGLAIFVLVRTFAMFAASWGVSSGTAMAQRAKTLDAATLRVRCGAPLLVLAAATLSLAFGR
jgi:hypothetical protein